MVPAEVGLRTLIFASTYESKTCGEFRSKLPVDEWENLTNLHVFDEDPSDDEPFGADDVPGHADGDLSAVASTRGVSGWFPEDLIEKYDARSSTSVLNGVPCVYQPKMRRRLQRSCVPAAYTVEQTDLDIN